MNGSNNLFLRLQTWAWGQEENFVTEVFAYLIRHLLQYDAGAAASILANLTGYAVPISEWDAGRTEISTQETVAGKRPDIVISAPGLLVYVEVKVESTLGTQQLAHYRERLQSSGINKTCLVLLTRYEEQAPDSQQPDNIVRWYQVAHWLESAMRTGLVVESSSLFLVEQFLGFLSGRRMTVGHVGQELTDGAKSLINLHSMLHKALLSVGLNPKTHVRPDWWGYNIGPNQYYVGVYLHEASLLRFRTYNDVIDRDKAVALGRGRLWTQFGRLRWEYIVDLATDEAAFFTMSPDEQMRFIENFVRESLTMAKHVALQEAGAQPETVEGVAEQP